VFRCNIVLRNFAMLYPAAFAPGLVFGLSGWYDDEPSGTGFERPDAKVVEALFTLRTAPAAPANVARPGALRPGPGRPAPTPPGRPSRVSSRSNSPPTRAGTRSAAPAPVGVLAAIRSPDDGTGAPVAELAEKRGSSAAAVKKAVNALVSVGDTT
jgi:hypothetical protein